MSCSRSKAVSAILGGAIGDGLGMAQEIFPKTSSLDQIHEQVLEQRRQRFPIQTDYETGGPWKHSGHIMKAGEWTDDTAMLLCLADSLLHMRKVDVADLMRRFVSWWSTGYNSCTGFSVGLGGNIRAAIMAFNERDPDRLLGGRNPYKDAGNGSLMRLAPVPVYFADSLVNADAAARLQTATTHNTPEALDASSLMCHVIWHGINGYSKADIFNTLHQCSVSHSCIQDIKDLANLAWRTKTQDQIRSLPGRALWSLEAALWSIYTTDSFEEAVVKAVSLGGDADTIGSITGQMAGAIYGLESVPDRWIHGICHSYKIIARAHALYDHGTYDPVTMDLR